MTTNRQTPSEHGDKEQDRPGLDEAVRGRPPATELAANVVRGGLIGLAETVPGVSGGTVALVTGIYTRAIASAKHLTDIPKAVLTRSDVRAEIRQVDWWLLVTVGVGMLLMVFSVAGIMADFVTNQPVYSKALFMGMIAMSVAIPFMEITRGAFPTIRSRLSAVALFAVLAVAVVVLTSLPGVEASNPSLILVFFAATIAICALVLPGVSGSFFLLVIGLYAPTLTAVDERNLTYLAVFALGALVGLVSFVRVLERLLANYHDLAMVAAAGLLLGSLRALWPWQGENRELLAVSNEWPAAVGLFAVGVAVVAVVAIVQHRLAATRTP
ncbi:membrane protein [Rhodococcus sp. B7740]|uniref:DUF368 domain-containing protein n=1 Tax=Rhodococcus sp. B7740 TaxID=1564114 RepID=UPI0005D75AA6|nr:DUF368 domain-containing protein [Rhodococcus sp. B7740]AJW40849.1 membrane protein [Rhodococcus sp. B7740]